MIGITVEWWQLLNKLYNVKGIMYYGHIIFVFMINVYMN